MNASSPKARDIFLAGIKLPPSEWEAFLDHACGRDEELRRRLVGLLNAHRDAGSFLAPEAPAFAKTIDFPNDETSIADGPGTSIGPYKLLAQIGEGGFGVVFIAEQTQPVRREVALKVLKPGMDTKQVVARFEAERQALAIMDHPNIAKVYDGGVTPSGRPFFVMELVKGVPITEHCDQHRLTPRQRLELFVHVCQAVQHAHQKGIIHRDLKPSNVLVSVHDTNPVVKVIDFGVAKALGQELTEKTIFTGFAQMVGTPLYMSPEQAGQSGLDIDTRSDIYSLGVLLYELLTGTTPLTREHFKEAQYDELRRIIREDEPPKPSTRLNESRDVLPSIAANRNLEPKKLQGVMRGELDWIVMKALEKDRNRRYETANGFALDVQRYLSDEPVLACPPSAGYRLHKFARRNKGSLAVAGLVLFFVVLLGAVIGWGVRDREARELQVVKDREEQSRKVARERDARKAAAEQAANLAMNEAAGWQKLGKWPETLSAAKRAEGFLAHDGSNALLQRVGELRLDIEMVLRLEDARLRFIEDLKAGDNLAGMHAAVGRAFREYGIDVETLPAEKSAELIRARSVHLELAGALDHWAAYTPSSELRNKLIAVARKVDSDEWRNRVRDALWAESRGQQLLAELAASEQVRALPASSLSILGMVLRLVGLTDDGVALLRDAQQRHPDDFWINIELALAYGAKQPPPWDDIIRCYSMALALRPRSALTLYNVGATFFNKGRPDEAVPYLQQAVEVDPDNAYAHHVLGLALDRIGRRDEVLAQMRRAVELEPDNAMHLANLGSFLRTENPEEAVTWYQKAIAANPKYARAYMDLGALRQARGQIDEAIANFRKAVEVDPESVENLGALTAALADAVALKPDDPNSHFELGSAYAGLGNWKEAAAVFDRGLSLDPTDHERWCQGAALFAWVGDLESFRRACRELVTRFGDIADPQIAERAAKACLQLPNAVSAADFERVEKLAERAVTGTESSRLYRFFVLARGLADYRAGRHTEAQQRLERFAPNLDGWAMDATAFAVMAMAQRRLNKADEADAALANAKAIVAQKMPDPAQGRPFGVRGFHTWLHAQVLCREAEDDVLSQALATRKAKLGAAHTDTLNAMADLADRYDVTGRDADAVKLYEELLALRKTSLGASHPHTLHNMAKLADGYSRLGRHAEAVTMYDELLPLRKAESGPDHPDTLITMSALANSYAALGRDPEAIEIYKATLKLENARPAPDDDRRVATMSALAACNDKLGRYGDSLALYEEMLALRKARLGPYHPGTTWCLRPVAQTLIKLDRGEQAVPLIDEFVARLSGKVARRSIEEMILLRMRQFEKTQDAAGCRKSADMWEAQRWSLGGLDFDFLYDAACFRAITAKVIRAADHSETATTAAAQEADRAMNWLRQAAVTKIEDLQTMKQDPDLDFLRGREDFKKLVALRESQVAAREFEIGVAHARQGFWKEAAAAFDRGLGIYPLDHERWCQGAALFARIGDIERYRRACRELVTRFGDSDQRAVGERATKACLLLPDALSAAEFERVEKLAEVAVSGDIKSDGLSGFTAFAKGIASYRAGRYAEAVQWIERFGPRADAGWVHNDATALAVLAMAHHRLGHVNEAAAALAQVKSIIDQKMPDPPQEGWHVWSIVQVLYREAQALVADSSRD